MSQIDSDKRYFSKDEIITEALFTRRGVCQHYSELFQAMGNSIGLECYLISGYTRNALGEIDDYSHAWNGILIDTNYFLIDVTWASGYRVNDRYINEFNDNYFLKSPSIFIRDHMPFDPIWQFSNNPISNNDFINQNFSNLDSVGSFSYRDSISHYLHLSHIEQLENSNRRIIKCGVKNGLIQDQIDEIFIQLTNAKYNSAIDTLNSGIDYYNQFITNKNRQFRNPKMDDSEILELILNAGNGIYAANEIIYSLMSNDNQLNNLLSEAREKLPNLISDLETEKEFVDKYLKKWRPFRIFMFLTFR